MSYQKNKFDISWCLIKTPNLISLDALQNHKMRFLFMSYQNTKFDYSWCPTKPQNSISLYVLPKHKIRFLLMSYQITKVDKLDFSWCLTNPQNSISLYVLPKHKIRFLLMSYQITKFDKFDFSWCLTKNTKFDYSWCLTKTVCRVTKLSAWQAIDSVHSTVLYPDLTKRRAFIGPVHKTGPSILFTRICYRPIIDCKVMTHAHVFNKMITHNRSSIAFMWKLLQILNYGFKSNSTTELLWYYSRLYCFADPSMYIIYSCLNNIDIIWPKYTKTYTLSSSDTC